MGREQDERRRTKKDDRRGSALTIAGLDPSGGAGLSADLRAFRAAGVWGASVCAVLTVQSTKGLAEAHAVPAKVVRASAVACLVDMDVRAMKSGALGSEENVRAVAELFAECKEIPSIVDPVMAPTRATTAGARLDGNASDDALWSLVKAATLITPNADEASALLGRTVRTEAEARAAAEDLVRAGARAALLKGGHVDGGAQAIDWLATKEGVTPIARRRIATPALHGTGCALSALIAGKIASRSRRGIPSDEELLAAIRWARGALDRALRAPIAVGGGGRVLDVRQPGSLREPEKDRRS